jgi:hypothetical protein
MDGATRYLVSSGISKRVARIEEGNKDKEIILGIAD